MTYAYRCDECGTFEEGDPPLSLTMQIEGDDAGLLGNLFGMGNGPSDTFDFCSIGCAEAFDFNTVQNALINDVSDKHELLEAEAAAAQSDMGSPGVDGP